MRPITDPSRILTLFLSQDPRELHKTQAIINNVAAWFGLPVEQVQAHWAAQYAAAVDRENQELQESREMARETYYATLETLKHVKSQLITRMETNQPPGNLSDLYTELTDRLQRAAEQMGAVSGHIGPLAIERERQRGEITRAEIEAEAQVAAAAAAPASVSVNEMRVLLMPKTERVNAIERERLGLPPAAAPVIIEQEPTQ